MRWRLGVLLVMLVSATEVVADRIELCFNYGCAERVLVLYPEAVMQQFDARFEAVTDPESERAAILEVLADLYRVAGGQTPILSDRGGNFQDQGVFGRMDCIDHSTTTTRLLWLMAERGWLRHHRVLAPARRTRLLAQHFAAVIEERRADEIEWVQVRPPAHHGDAVGILLGLCDCPEILQQVEVSAPAADVDLRPGERYVVDTWFLDHAEAAVLLPLTQWMRGEGPNVE